MLVFTYARFFHWPRDNDSAQNNGSGGIIHTTRITEKGRPFHADNSEQPVPPTQNFTTTTVPSSKNRSGAVRTLVILIGNLRCGELAWKSLYDNLLDYPKNSGDGATMDKALAIGDTDFAYQNASLFQRSRYYWKFEEYGDDWSAALDTIDPRWKTTVAPLIHDSSLVLGGVQYGHWQGSGAISFWIRWFLSERLKEDNVIGQYDRFVITRSDHFYMCPHDLSKLSLEYLWVPKGQDFGGVTDRHLIVPSEHVLTALNILPHVLAHPNDYPRLSEPDYNPESLLRDVWMKQGIGKLVKRFPRMMFTCVNPFMADHTRWRKAGPIAEKEGVRLKYTKEYDLSGTTCKGGNHSSSGRQHNYDR